MDLAMHVFLKDFQVINAPSSMKTYPPVNFEFLMLNI
jgi:hypothetical protein